MINLVNSFLNEQHFQSTIFSGGTVDIAAHQINADGTVEELIPASGGPWGGVKVDEK